MTCRQAAARKNAACILLGLLSPALVLAQGIWSSSGIVPSVEIAAKQTVMALDGQQFVQATSHGLQLGNRQNAIQQPFPIAAMPPLWEVMWAPDSRWVAINFSDGGAVGTWDTEIFATDQPTLLRPLGVSALIRHAAHALPICKPAEEVNVALLGWSQRHDSAFLVAEVPPHSSCYNMGTLQGFELSLTTGKIVAQLSENELRQQWQKRLGERLAKH